MSGYGSDRAAVTAALRDMAEEDEWAVRRQAVADALPKVPPAKVIERQILACAHHKIPARLYRSLEGTSVEQLDASARALAVHLGIGRDVPTETPDEVAARIFGGH